MNSTSTASPFSSSSSSSSPPSSSSSSSSTSSTWYTSAFYIGITCPAILCFLGIPLNIANIVIVRHKAKKSSHFAYVTVLSAVDSFVLITRASGIYLPYTAIPMTSSICAIIQFLVQTSSQLSSWVLVFLCFERAMVVKFPFSRLTLFNSRRAFVSMGSASVVISLLNIVTLFSVHYDQKLGMCAYRVEYLDLVRTVWNRVEVLTFAFVPFMLLIIFNIIIGTSLYQSRNIHLNRIKGKGETTNNKNVLVDCLASTFKTQRCNLVIKHKLGCLAFRHRDGEDRRRRKDGGKCEIERRVDKIPLGGSRQKQRDDGLVDGEKEGLVKEHFLAKGRISGRSVSSFSLSALKEMHVLQTQQQLAVGLKFIPNSNSYDCVPNRSIVVPEHFEKLLSSSSSQNSTSGGFTTIDSFKSFKTATKFSVTGLRDTINRPKSVSTSVTDMSTHRLLPPPLQYQPKSKSVSLIDFCRESKTPRKSRSVGTAMKPKLQSPLLLQQQPLTSTEEDLHAKRTELLRVESQFRLIVKSAITASLVFFLTKTPYCLVSFFIKLLRSSIPSHHSFVFLATFSVMLSDANHVANFFIYSLRTTAVLRSLKSFFLKTVHQARFHNNCCCTTKRRGATLLSMFKRSSFGSSGTTPLPVSDHTTVPAHAGVSCEPRDSGKSIRLATNV